MNSTIFTALSGSLDDLTRLQVTHGLCQPEIKVAQADRDVLLVTKRAYRTTHYPAVFADGNAGCLWKKNR